MRGMASKGAGQPWEQRSIEGALRASLGGMWTRWEAVAKKGVGVAAAAPAALVCAACWSGEGWGCFPTAAQRQTRCAWLSPACVQLPPGTLSRAELGRLCPWCQ